MNIMSKVCPMCRGTGGSGEEICRCGRCGGTGYVQPPEPNHPIADACRDWLLAAPIVIRKCAAYYLAQPGIPEEALDRLAAATSAGVYVGNGECRAGDSFRAAALSFVREVNAATIDALPDRGVSAKETGSGALNWTYTDDLRRIFCGGRGE